MIRIGVDDDTKCDSVLARYLSQTKVIRQLKPSEIRDRMKSSMGSSGVDVAGRCGPRSLVTGLDQPGK